jgi:tetratricopeptide (TPR) repeat protein
MIFHRALIPLLICLTGSIQGSTNIPETDVHRKAGEEVHVAEAPLGNVRKEATDPSGHGNLHAATTDDAAKPHATVAGGTGSRNEDSAQAPNETTAVHTEHVPESPSKPLSISAEEVVSLLRIGETKTAQADYESAEIAYRQILSARASADQDRDALLGLARMYRRKNELTKAAAVYEKLIREFPGDASLPVAYLELGRTHRALGAYRLAIARFYSVINSTLKLTEEGADTYRQLARTAQFEVAETYFVAGDFAEAARFFARLKLLDLAPADRSRAHFKSAYALHMGGDYEKAISTLRSFLETNPDDENTPEALYLLSVSFRRLGKNQESLAAALGLLKLEQGRETQDPKRWAYWQRRTGNQLANEFYEQGDASSALAIYVSLAGLTSDPIWRLPVLYQIGLCYERLRSGEKARETFTQVVNDAKTADIAPNRAAELAELAKMATWRLKHLDWQSSADRELNTFFQDNSTPIDTPIESEPDTTHRS